jgi:hypothetical protein
MIGKVVSDTTYGVLNDKNAFQTRSHSDFPRKKGKKAGKKKKKKKG